jgi:uncharacterized protein
MAKGYAPTLASERILFNSQTARAVLRGDSRPAAFESQIDVTTFSRYNRGMTYEWDERKRRVNLKKHGIDFIDVPEVFDGAVVIIPDERFDYGETRFVALGILKSLVVVVAYTERGENIRMISARKATKNEQIYYFQEIAN